MFACLLIHKPAHINDTMPSSTLSTQLREEMRSISFFGFFLKNNQGNNLMQAFHGGIRAISYTILNDYESTHAYFLT